MNEHQKYPLTDWKHEVAEGNTILSYREWLEHRLEAEQVKTFDVEICDVAITRRTVAIPLMCPNRECGADLSQPAALLLWEYQDQKRHATAEENGELDWPDVPKAGEGTLQMSWHCAECEHTLAVGKESEKPFLACYDCGQPAKFYVFCDVDKERTPETLFCGLCAIEKAADGSTVERTEEHGKELGYEERTG